MGVRVSDEQKNNLPGDGSSEGSNLDPDWLEGDAPSGDDDDVEPYGLHEKTERETVIEGGASESSEPGAPVDEPAAEPVKETKTKTRKSVNERLAVWRAGAAGEGAALSRDGKLGWKFFVIMSVAALIGAVVLSVTNTVYPEDTNFWQKLGPGSLESIRVLLRAPIHLSIGMLAFALSAWAVGVRAGRGDMAAARIGLAVSLAIMALQLQWAFPGQRVVVYLIAFALYFTTVLLSFRCPPRVAGMLIVLHIGLFAAIAGLGWLIVWIGM